MLSYNFILVSLQLCVLHVQKSSNDPILAHLLTNSKTSVNINYYIHKKDMSENKPYHERTILIFYH